MLIKSSGATFVGCLGDKARHRDFSYRGFCGLARASIVLDWPNGKMSAKTRYRM
jgi:hypothetical protein